MGIFTILEERAMPPAGDDFWYEPTSRFRDGPATPESALSSTPVWAAVNLIAGTVGSMPLILYHDLENGGKERALDRPLYNLLRWAPNSYQTAVELFEMGQGHLCLRGNAFFRLEVNRADELIAIVPLHPDRMKLKLLDGGVVEYHYDAGSGRSRVFSAEEILHVKGLSSDGLIGYSPITIGAGVIAMSDAAERYGARFFENSATPSGILSHPGKLKPESRANIKTSWQAAHGSGRQHSVALLEEGLSWTAMSVSPEEAQFLETRKFQAEEIARLFNVPPHLLMLLDRSTFSNVTEQNRSFATNCIRPWAIRWEQAIRKSIIERFSTDTEASVEFDMNELLRPDTMARAQANQILLTNGALTINEWRTRENLNPIEGDAGSTNWMPLNIAPVAVAESMPDAEPDDEPANALRDELRSQGFEIADSSKLPELRSLANRRKIAEATKPLIEAATRRLVRRESKAVKRMMTKQLSGGLTGREEQRGTDGLANDIEAFYFGEFVDVIVAELLPIIRSYAQQIYTQAALEVAMPPELTEDLEEFIRGYMAVSANGYAKQSRQALQAIISNTDFSEMAAEIDLLLAEWAETRARRVATRQTTEGNGAFSKFAYVAGGAIALRWVTSGSNCPFCKKLSGRTVLGSENFLEAGSALDSDQGQLKVRKNVGHPPAHPGCDCFISPSL